MKIAVYGSKDNVLKDNREKAKELGRVIARKGHTLITGACPGLPNEAVSGASDYDGEIIGFSPGVNLKDHIERFGFPSVGFTELRFIPRDFQYKDDKIACCNLRNVYSTTESDAIVIIQGGIGSLGEFVNFYKSGKPIGVLSETGGLADFVDQIIDNLISPTDSQSIYYGNPRLLIENLENKKA